MKLLVFAHTPPPHHGQSYMVQLMLEGLGGDHRKRWLLLNKPKAASLVGGIECYHVNCRLSRKLQDIGDVRFWKFLLLLFYCLQAIWCRFRYGVTNFYYVPAPGKSSAVYRDWLVMFLCRPFFSRLILHWHAAGLAKWLETSVQSRARAITYQFMKQPDLSLVLSGYNRADAEKLFSKQIEILGNGIADPCPDFVREILPRRLARFAARKKLLAGEPLTPSDIRDTGPEPQVLHVLFLSHCTREKGVFDAMAGAALACEELVKRGSRMSLRLTLAGSFIRPEEQKEFRSIMQQPAAAQLIEYRGFVSGAQKAQLLREADMLCFPTYYQNENQPVNLIEAMAFGLAIVTTRWRSLPELFDPGYSGLVDICSPEQVGAALLALAQTDSGIGFRDRFLGQFTLQHHLSSLARALLALDQEKPERLRQGLTAEVSA